MKGIFLKSPQEYEDFKSTTFECTCSWQGAGEQLVVGEIYPESNIGEYHCPKCDKKIVNVSFPIDNSKPYTRKDDNNW